MSTEAVKTWLYDRLINSLSDPTPVAFPRDSSYGVLYEVGFNTTNVTVTKDPPATRVKAPTKGVIVLYDTNEAWNEPVPDVNFEVSQSFELEVYWLADFTGKPAQSVPPTYTDELAASPVFRLFVNRIVSTLLKATFIVRDDYNEQGVLKEARYQWELTDPTTGEKSCIARREQGSISVTKNPPGLAANKKDRFYGSVVNVRFLEKIHL